MKLCARYNLVILPLLFALVGGGYWWYVQAKEKSQIEEYAYLYMEAVFRKDAECDYIGTICTADGRLSFLKLFTIQSFKSWIESYKGEDKYKGISRAEFRSIMKVVSISKKYNDAVVTVELSAPPENKPQFYKLPFKLDVHDKIWKIGAISAFDFF